MGVVMQVLLCHRVDFCGDPDELKRVAVHMHAAVHRREGALVLRTAGTGGLRVRPFAAPGDGISAEAFAASATSLDALPA